MGGAGEPAGIIGAYSTRTHQFEAEDRAFLAAVAAVLAGAREQAQTTQALHESEARARAILDTTVDGVVTISERGIIESFNSAAEQIFGYTEAEVLGKNVHVLMPEPYHSEHDGYIDAYKRTGQRRIIGIGREVVGQRKDGSTFPLDLAVSEVMLPNRRIFTGMLRDISERRELEQAVLRVAEDERRRIGQDLHDGLGQMLTGTGLIARGLARKLEAIDEGVSKDADELVELIKEADAYARTISRGLVPVEFDVHGLDDALQRLATNTERLFEIACTFKAHGQDADGDVPDDVSPHLFRIAQEAISNAAYHGKARVVTITLSRTPEWLTLQVADDGIGFPGLVRSAAATRLEPVPGKRDKSMENRGMGVRIMHYRARIIGGALEIRLGSDGGTVVTCAVPTDRTSPSPTP
ncbi:MAG: PAS domain S-box protein [Bacteroidetes bacterium]|nr:PAS domain S-box protein [Bacteroidota bacterium]